MKKVMKGILVIAIACMVLISLSGCARVNYEVNVNKDGSADVSYVIGYDKEFLSSMGVSESDLGEEGFADMEKEATEDGYEVEKYNDDTTVGFKASKHFDHITDFTMDDVGEEQISTEGIDNKISFDKKLLDTKISQNAKIDLTTLSEEEDSETANITNMLLGQMKVSYKITLPFKVGDNNATTVSEDGKTLEWTLKAGEVNEVRFEAQENLNAIVFGGIGAIILIIVVAVIVVATKSKNKTKKTAEKVTTTAATTQKKNGVKKVEKKEEKTEKKETPKKDKKEEN